MAPSCVCLFMGHPPIKRHGVCALFMGGCYSVSAAPGSGVCSEARDGVCVRRAEEVRAEVKEPRTGCQAQESGGPETCHTCGAVIGGVSYCSQCNVDSSGTNGAPTDGTCQADNAVCSTTLDGVCTTCTGSSFMFKGGCYRTGQDPGQTMCKTAADGVCTEAVTTKEYFVPPGADNTHQSVISCADETPVELADQKQYKGIANCLTCTKPTAGKANTPKAATCDECAPGFFVASSGALCSACAENCLTCTDGTATNCKSCTANTYFLGAADGSQGKCVSCGDAAGSDGWKGVEGCVKCTKPASAGAATCTECTGDLYLKTDGSTTSCVTAGQCNNGFFPTTDSNNKKVCVKCSDNNNGGIADCAKCSLKASPARAGAAVTCTECDSTKKLSPLKDACLTDCPAGTYDDNNVCKSCNTIAGCSTCSSGTVCTKCETGKIVKTADGATSCIDESACNNGFFVKEQDGSKTCEACDSTCKTCSGAAAQCTSCNANKPYLKKTENSQTGTCVDAAGCTNGNTHYADDADPKTCKACAEGTFEGCETCEKSTEGAVACMTCGSQKKIRPDKKGCIDACPPDVSTEKSGVCECVEGYAPTADGSSCASSSANRSGLSTGAIAGISVAAVVACSVPLTGYLPLQNEQSEQSQRC
ncbi:Variant-specific surface protein [Giardia duodenalis]|uniref:Variant-specific surface protein n=1 Tax=Giardia intestinalis TaxID=5741 RepID=V6TVP5_GIAIN|nr:Variant-specific surface protein [Giardia intestinalis]